MLQNAYGPGLFRQLFGHVFAHYIDRLIGEFTYSGGILAKTYYKSPKFQGTNDEVCDGLIQWAETTMFMEYKAGLLTTRQKYAGNQDETIRGIEDLLARDKPGGKKGAGQLADSLRRVLSGEIMVSESTRIDLSQCRQILAAIVVYDEGLGLHAIRNLVEERFRESLRDKGVSDGRIGPLLILTIRDIEVLEDVRQVASVERLLLDYAEFVRRNPRERTGSLNSFVYNRFPKKEANGNSLTEKTFQRVLDEAADELQKRQAGTQEAHVSSNP
jgi:hypothetical protein